MISWSRWSLNDVGTRGAYVTLMHVSAASPGEAFYMPTMGATAHTTPSALDGGVHGIDVRNDGGWVAGNLECIFENKLFSALSGALVGSVASSVPSVPKDRTLPLRLPIESPPSLVMIAAVSALIRLGLPVIDAIRALLRSNLLLVD